MAQPARARVDEDGHGAGLEAKGLRAPFVEHALDPLHLDEVVSRPHGSELTRAPLARPLGDGVRVGAVEPSPRLGVLQVVFGADAAELQQGRRALAQDPVELGAVQLQGRLAAGARRRQAGDLVDERLLAVAQVVGCDRASPAGVRRS